MSLPDGLRGLSSYQKSSANGTGTFNFSLGGLNNTADSVTTTSPSSSTYASSAQTNIGTPVTAATITETVPATWNYSATTCTNASSTKVGTTIANGVSIPASAMTAGAVITCQVSNTHQTANLSLSKSDGQTVVNPNGTVVYTLRVDNAGPGSIADAVLKDPSVTGLNVTDVSCSSAANNTCSTKPSGLTAGYPLPVLASGAFYEIKVTGTVTATSGSIVNSANVTSSILRTDNTANNLTATDTDTINQPPVANPDSATTPVNTAITFSLTGNDTDPDGTINAATVDLDPNTAGTQNSITTAQGTFTVDSSGNVTFTPVAGFSGKATTPYTVQDNNAATSNQATITVNVTPTAANDTGTTPAGTPVVTNVLSNDKGSLAASSVVFPASDSSIGTLSNSGKTLAVAGQGQYDIQTDGSIKFTPVSTYTGTATAVPYQVSDTSGQTATANLTITVTSQPPVAQNVTSTTLTNTDPQRPVSALVATDPNAGGTISSYTIATLPATASGTLYYNGSPVTAGQIITDPTKLTFDPAATYSGNAAFNYTATDNYGLTSNTATVTIPITVALGALQCTTTVYGLFGNSGNIATASSVYALDSNGNLTTKIVDLPSGSANGSNAAALAISPDNTTIYTAGGDAHLRSYNTTTGVWTDLGALPNYPGARPLRMTTDKNGNVYISSTGVLWVYNGSTITSKTLSYTDSSGLTPAPNLSGSSNISGDFIMDNAGNLYLIANISNSNVDVYRIQNLNSSTSDPVVTFVERLVDPGWTSSSGTSTGSGTYTGVASLGTGIYATTVNGRYTSLDLGTLNVSQVKDPITTTSGTTRYINDLASCYYPSLLPKLSSSKAVTDTTTGSSTIASPGDTLQYTITIHNAGNIAADGVTFQDLIPPGTTYVAGSTTTNGAATADISGAMPYTTAQSVKSAGAANGTNLVGTNQDVVIKFSVTVNAGVTTVSNTGTLGYNDNSDGNLTPKTTPTNTVTIGSDTPKFTVVKTATPYIKATADTATGEVSNLNPNKITYTITVTNTGNSALSSVAVTDPLPANLKFDSAAATNPDTATVAYSTAAGTYGTATTIANTGTATNLTFTVPNLTAVEPGKSAQIVFTATPTIASNANAIAFSNTATGTAGTTSQPSNAAMTNVIYPKLSKTVQNITKRTAASPKEADGLPGDIIEYCLNYNNYSTTALDNYVINDQVPGNTAVKTDSYSGKAIQLKRVTSSTETTTYTAAAGDDAGTLSSTGGSYGQGTMTINLGSVAAGESGSACFQVTIR